MRESIELFLKQFEIPFSKLENDEININKHFKSIKHNLNILNEVEQLKEIIIEVNFKN